MTVTVLVVFDIRPQLTWFGWQSIAARSDSGPTGNVPVLVGEGQDARCLLCAVVVGGRLMLRTPSKLLRVECLTVHPPFNLLTGVTMTSVSIRHLHLP